MPADRSPKTVLEELSHHARGDDLARLVHTVAFAAADEKRARFEDGLAEVTERIKISREDADTSYGNVLAALERGSAEAPGSASRALLAGLLARGVTLSPPAGAEAEARVAESLLWLATHTSIDALPALDDALGERADGLWLAVAGLVRKADAGDAPLIGRAGALIGAATLQRSRAPVAQAEAKALADEARDPILRALLSGAPEGGDAAETDAAIAQGELAATPRHPVVLFILGLTGILTWLIVGRLLAKVALRYRCPAELRVNARGVTVSSRAELLGRTIRTQETHIPIEALLKASREVRYPRAAMYAGLFALAVGSYFGVSFFVDGARAGSPELLGIGLLFVALGVALDFALGSVATTAKGRCLVVLVPRKGAALAIGAADPARVDAALKRLLRPARA